MNDLIKEISKVFSGKKVLVTGHTGFKGSWLSLWLNELGADVSGYALPPKHEDDHFNLLGLNKLIYHFEGDIRDLSSLQHVFDEVQPEFLFHLAAQPLVRYSYQEPKITFDTNIGGSVNILECVRNTPSLKSVIYVTSDKCYQNKEWVWGYRENDELGGRDPYSASKAAAELIFSSYVDSFFKNREGFGIASVRAGNVIGGGDWSLDRIVPDSIKSLKNGQPITIRNPLNVSRLLLLKYEYTRNKENIYLIKEKLEKVYLSEKIVLNNILEELKIYQSKINSFSFSKVAP
jgi:CDP-glucose 4,6-dehydratase